ncbi:zinc finger protein 729-like [Lytechinus variegatus]|uniref:zinc finger protein 729-like n=1 Tax=Lytechinus variegatus TaxID=7654 RepID=UPI001BB13555|nr:zinc finger protein 729-like [Lytechinus variegatus]XP_041470307.1 zinc finger protein 729-like [Lytechinus variegatus]XP_041470308.1 zinc finger protein 729-like [Lytechinus variegatus]
MDSIESSAYTVILIDSDEWEIQDACEQTEEDGCNPGMEDQCGTDSLNYLKAVLIEEDGGHEIDSSKITIPAGGQVEEESFLPVVQSNLGQTELTESDGNNCISISDPLSPSQSMLMCSEVIIGGDVDENDPRRIEGESGELPHQLSVLQAKDVVSSPDILIQDSLSPDILQKPQNDRRSETGIEHSMTFKCSLCAKVFRSESSFLRHKNVHRLNSRRPVTQVPQLDIHYIDGTKKKDHLKNQEFGWTINLHKNNSDGLEAQSKSRGSHQEDSKSLKMETSDSATKSSPSVENISTSKRMSESQVNEKKQVNRNVPKPEDVHERNKTLSCGLCIEGFSSSAELDAHMMIHSNFSWDEHGGLNFPSDAERKSSKQKINDAVQMAKAGFGKHNFSCNLCGKVFSRQAQLKFHLISHSDVSCVLCDGLTFATSEELKIHLKTHFGSKKPRKKHDRRLSCNICKKYFAHPHQLRKHLSLKSCVPDKSVMTVQHKGFEHSVAEGFSKSPQKVNDQFSCSISDGWISCETRKATKHTANKHKTVQSGHSKTRPSKGQSKQPQGQIKTLKVIPAQRQLAKKRRKHSATKQTSKTSQEMTSDSVGSIDRAFPCYLCGVEFLKPAELELHIHLHSAYNCEQCDGLTFASREELRSHMLNGVHAVQLKCPVCKAMYASQSSLSDHIATHSDATPSVCEYCSSTFHSLKSLKIHQIMDHANSKVIKN